MIKEADIDGDGEINYSVECDYGKELIAGIRQYDSLQIGSLLLRDMDMDYRCRGCFFSEFC